MSIAYWCVLAVGLMHIPLAAIGQVPDMRIEDLREPRPRAEKLTGWRIHAYWAHLNQMEVFPLFAAGVIIAALSGADMAKVDTIAVWFTVSRVVYAALYIAGFGWPRSLVYMVGIALNISLFTLATV